MKIGYACINRSIGCTSSSTFRLKSYSEGRLVDTVQTNLKCLTQILRFNLEHQILFFRITSDLVPFASHPICQFDWQDYFRDEFRKIGRYARAHGMRLSMHPGQYTILNSKDERIFHNSVKELEYHADVLDLLQMPMSAKMQIHVGGVYGEKAQSLERFIERYEVLDDTITKRLVIENDEKSYSVSDCRSIHDSTGIPVVFDTLHHEVNNNNETIQEGLYLTSSTWKKTDGIPMVHYSSQELGKSPGRHAELIDLDHFKGFLSDSKKIDFDLMLEIKSKETAAIRAIEVALQDVRFNTG